MWECLQKYNMEKALTFVDLAYSSNLQVLLVVLLIIKTKQNAAEFGWQHEGGGDVQISQCLQSSRQIPYSCSCLTYIMELQNINH